MSIWVFVQSFVLLLLSWYVRMMRWVIVIMRWIRFKIRISEWTFIGMGLQAQCCTVAGDVYLYKGSTQRGMPTWFPMRRTKLKLEYKWKRKQKTKKHLNGTHKMRTNAHVYSTYTLSVLLLCDLLLRGHTHALSGTQMLKRHALDVSESLAVRKRGLRRAAEMGWLDSRALTQAAT